MADTKHRLAELDGLRAIAVLMVVAFHYNVPFTREGSLGVELFFIISGFVIFMTLDECRGPADFAVRRFARLWPALAVCSVVTFFFVDAIHLVSSEVAAIDPRKFVASLLLFPKSADAADVGKYIEGAHWTLAVEIRFYAIAALLFWSLPRRYLSLWLCFFAMADVAARQILLHFKLDGLANFQFEQLIPHNMPWFAVGAIFYDIYKRRISWPLGAAGLLPLALIIAIAGRSQDHNYAAYLALNACFFVLIGIIAAHIKIPALASPWLRWVGLRSYSVYLLHDAIGLSILATLPASWQLAAALGVAIFVLALSDLSYRIVENPVRRAIMDWFNGPNKIKARDLMTGDVIQFDNGTARIGSISRSDTLIGLAGQLKSAMAIRVMLDEGRELLLHPDQNVPLTKESMQRDRVTREPRLRIFRT